MILRTLVLALSTVGSLLAAPLLEYTFPQAGQSQPSTGTLPIALQLADAANQPRDILGRSAPGVRGSGDRYLDLVTNPGGYGQHEVDEDGIDALPAFTLSGWINTDSISQSGARLIDNFDNTSGFRLVGQPSGAIRLVVDQLNATTGSNFLEAGQWIFFAVTYDGTATTNNVRFYKGRRDLPVNTPFFTGSINAGEVGNDFAKFTVGKDRALAGNAFIGRYDNIRLHAGVLTAAEIDALRAGDVAGYVEPPVLGAVVDVTQAPYFADNTGATDSSAAIQAALSDNQFKNRTIYFPNGTYIVSRSLFISTDNVNAGFTHLRGQSREGTVLRLRDNSDGTAGSENFADPAQPRIMLNFFVGPWTNNGYYHSVEDMTFDTGVGNSGATALEFQSNNVGWMENVTIRTSDPQRRGVIGLKIDRNLVGMGMVRNVSVEGFDYGIRTGHYHASFVFEDVSVSHQRVAGLWNFQKPISLRRFTSENSVPAIINTDVAGQIVLIDSTLSGGDAGVSAIDNQAGYLFARNVTTSGYASAIRNGATVVPGDNVTEFVSSQRYTLWDDTPQTSLNLPIVDLPIAPIDDGDDVYVVDGAAQGDDTAAIQAAIDSGKTTVFLPLDNYTISDTIRIRGNVRRILGQNATLVASAELRAVDKPVFLFEDGGTQPTVWIERLKSNFQTTGRHTWIQHNSSNDLVLRHLFIAYGKAYRNEGSGRLFMEDVAAGGANSEMEYIPAFIFKDQQVWAWQFNPEGCIPHVTNDGGSLWVFGFKVGENHGPYFYTVNGGRTELLGGVVNSLTYDPQPASRVIFTNDNSDAFTIFVERPRPGSENPTPVVIREIRDLETRELREGDLPRRQADYVLGAVVPYYRGATPRAADLPVVTVVPVRDRVEENDASPARFRFIASHPSAQPLTVHYTLGGDAIAGLDYDASGSSVTFPAGSTQVDLVLQPRNDVLPENPQRIDLHVLGHSSYIVAQPMAPATIVLHDDEQDLSRGLIAHYTFSGDFNDSSGAGNHGTPAGATIETEADGNGVGRFPGGGAYVQIAGTADFGFMHDAFTTRSVALRFKADSVAGNKVILDEGGASHGLGIRIFKGELEVRTVTFTVPTIVRTPIEAGRWYHVTLSHDRGFVEMYLDGVPIGTATALRPETAFHRSAGALGAGVGGDVFNDGAGSFSGVLDEVRYYTRVLNDREVRTLAGIAAPPLTGYAAFRAAQFTTSEQLDQAISGLNADPDGDGLSNLLEYALGLAPKAANASGELPAVVGTESEWIFTYTRPTDRADVAYFVDASTNLTTWSTQGVVHELVTDHGATQSWRARFARADAPNLFFRLRIEATP